MSTHLLRARTLAATLVAAGTLALPMGVSTAHATEVGYGRRYGVGIILGDPTGVSGKAWLTSTNAIDIGLGGYGYGYRGGCFRDAAGRPVCDRGWGQRTLSVHADYLWQSKIVAGAVAQLDWHLGAGARALFLNDPCAFDCWEAGVRAPVGLDVTFTRPSFLEVFFELAPALYLIPSAFFGFDGGLGARAYF